MPNEQNVCKICDNVYKNALSLANHLKSHGITSAEYRKLFPQKVEGVCVFCGQNVYEFNESRSKTRKFKTCGRPLCASQRNTRTHSVETKDKIRQKRIAYMMANCVSTPWAARNRCEMSYLEKYFYDNVIVKYGLDKKYKIVGELPVIGYFIDFAFVDLKLAVELDGACHFKNGDVRIEHDFVRDKKLNEAGWFVYRIPYFDLKKDNHEKTIESFLEFLKKDFGDITFSNVNANYSRYIGHKKTPKIKRELRAERQKEQQYRIDLINNCDIDFSKFGWVTKASKLLNMVPQHINSWFRLYHLEFYELRCFKRSRQ